MTPDASRVAFLQLVERAVRIGALFPDLDDIDLADPAALAELQMILAEFNRALAAVKGFWKNEGVNHTFERGTELRQCIDDLQSRRNGS